MIQRPSGRVEGKKLEQYPDAFVLARLTAFPTSVVDSTRCIVLSHPVQKILAVNFSVGVSRQLFHALKNRREHIFRNECPKPSTNDCGRQFMVRLKEQGDLFPFLLI